MKIVIFTSNALRHKHIANTLTKHSDSALVVSECQPYDAGGLNEYPVLMRDHFAMRETSEKDFFGENDVFEAPTLPVLYKEVNLPFVYGAVKKYNPDAAFVFGSWILKEPILSIVPKGRFINLHLGLSPYYRGSGTNFWPLVNKEPEYIGATLLHIDAGIDTGDIIAHVRPKIVVDDTAHTIGCKTIIESGKIFGRIVDLLRNGEELPRVAQWKVDEEKVYKRSDFNEEALKKYYDNIKEGMFKDYAKRAHEDMQLISFEQ